MLPKNWILLRGLAREKRHWGEFPELFQKQFPEARIETLDFPGIGEHADIQSPSSIAGITEFIRTEAKQRFPADRFAILAVSLGGMVAMQWMKDYESDLDGAVLINSSSKDSSFYRRLRFQVWPQFLHAIARAQPRERELEIINILMNNEAAREKAGPCWMKVAQDHPIKLSTFISQLAAATRFRGLNKAPKLPVLLLNSLGDRLVDPGCSEALHKKMHWKLERHPWAGHDLPWDDPQWVIDCTHHFFS